MILLTLTFILIHDSLCSVKGSNVETVDDLNPLYLSVYLKENRLEEARNISTTDIGGLKSYSGYFTVNKHCGNHLFFWYFPAEENWDTAPLLLWLNGGPGQSSLLGLFEEIGPWRIENGSLINNTFSWTKKHNVIFFDQPVGTGFSFTENNCYANNMNVVAKEMYSALVQFFTMFPELQKNKFFITGESFAGHFNPAIATEIDKQNSKSDFKINLIGIVTGNPFIDFRCNSNGNMLFQLGIIDDVGRDIVLNKFNKIISAVEANNTTEVLVHFINKCYKDIISIAKLPNSYNILNDDGEFANMIESAPYVTQDSIRRAIHVGRIPFSHNSNTVFYNLIRDFFKSQSPDVEYLLKTNKYIVGFFSGQLDTICPYSSLNCVLRGIQWPGAEKYLNTSRDEWYVSDSLAGWVKRVDNLVEVVVRGSGHYVPRDQGEVALALMSAITDSEPGSELLVSLDFL